MCLLLLLGYFTSRNLFYQTRSDLYSPSEVLAYIRQNFSESIESLPGISRITAGVLLSETDFPNIVSHQTPPAVYATHNRSVRYT